MIKRFLFFVMIVPTMLFATTYGEKVAGAESAKFFVDSRIVSIRTQGATDRFVDVTYSGYNWDTTGAPDQTTQVTVDDEQTLKSSTGEGVVRWVPKTAEVHTLKHICNGATLIATFDVEGPTVKINRQKDASNRNTIYCEIVCDAPGAVIYYTTDGANPTVESLVYTGPFIVNPIGGAIVKAMAIADGYPQSRPVAVNFAPLGIEVVASASSGEFKVDGRAETGVEFASDGTEELKFSSLWDGDADAIVTIAQDGAVVFTRLTGEGTKTWSVDRNGRYVLTHTTYTNGVAGKVETAVFVVEGKDEPICPEGEEPGTGEVPEGGISKYDATYLYDGEGHTINTQALYAVTLTGSMPSFSFSLYGETGWQNDPLVYTNVGDYVMWYKIAAPGYIDFRHQAKLTILEAPKIDYAVACQRYPWNGLVDVDFDLSCELETAQIPLTLIVHDTVGGTNLPCRTLWVDGVAAEQIQVQSGHHRVTWDADADLPDGFECDRVTVEVKVE